MSCSEMIAAREAGGANSSESGFNFVAAACGPPCNPEKDETCPTSECHKWVETEVPLLIPDAMMASNCPKKVDPCGMGPGCGNDGSCGGYSPSKRGPGAGTALERTTTWEYDPDDPGLVLAVEQPSTSGSGVRRTSWIWAQAGLVKPAPCHTMRHTRRFKGLRGIRPRRLASEGAVL
ncbi:MAG: hypothetical protein GY856_53940, partial [bacterium]|nr:hypothetical protein [bacterium]